MACKIEIEKTINNDINKELPYRDETMSREAANKIVSSLNKTWGKFARVVQYTEIGGYRVVISQEKLNDAIDKEYKKQVKAEKELQEMHDFFNDPQEIEERPFIRPSGFYMGDAALEEQERRDFEETIDYENDELSLYLATKMKEQLGVDIPIRNTDMYNIISSKPPISKDDIDNKKSEC